jgi:hypothetical protein
MTCASTSVGEAIAGCLQKIGEAAFGYWAESKKPQHITRYCGFCSPVYKLSGILAIFDQKTWREND